MENLRADHSETIDIFVPLEIKRRSGTATLMIPKNSNKVDDQKHFDNKILKSLAKAYKWKMMLEKAQVSCLSEIAQREKATPSYVSRVFNLNFLSPRIIDKVLNGAQPRTLKLQDIIINEIPDSWQEQEEVWGF